jgi:uracil-DNA glycosylase
VESGREGRLFVSESAGITLGNWAGAVETADQLNARIAAVVRLERNGILAIRKSPPQGGLLKLYSTTLNL